MTSEDSNTVPSGMAYNLLQLEVQCSNLNRMSISEWYCAPIEEREMKVASMMLPSIATTLESRKMEQQLKIKAGAV